MNKQINPPAFLDVTYQAKGKVQWVFPACKIQFKRTSERVNWNFDILDGSEVITNLGTWCSLRLNSRKKPVNDPCIYCGSSFDNFPGIWEQWFFIFLALSIWSFFTIHPAAENSNHYLVNNLAECFLQFTMNSRQLLGISVGFMNRNKDFVNLINCFIHASLQK